ncbi:MAG: hypothetical protein HQ592_12635, partial [Planctomycetes bacterium]|nr:hypothetical protein [Planctomycetota bacterium]
MRPKMKMQRKTKKKPTPRVIEANDDVRLISFEPCDLQIEAAADEKTPPTFSVVAYTGGAMRIFAFMDPVVVDLRGLKVERETLPVRLDHDRRQGVGHTTKVSVKAKSITAQGIISRSNSWARDVASSGASGFPWQASIGAAVLKVESVAAGAKAIANGRSFSGPVDIIRASVLKEISFVDSGADPKTSVQIAAEEKEYDMKFEDWLKAKGFDPEAITDEQRASLQAAYDAEQAAPKEPDAKPETGAAAETVQAQATETIADPVAEMRTAAAAEAKRIAAVRRVCAGEHPEIEAKAIEEAWPETKVELEVLRASRPQMPAVHAAGEAQALPRVLEAACMVAGGMEE